MNKPYFSFQWHITDTCDQRCKHCYIFSGNNNKPLLSMSWPDMERVLENCLDFCQTFEREPYFFITGGDPILHPDFWRLLETLHEKRIGFSILGNPFHLTDEVCQRLKELGCEQYQLSLDGMARTHDWFRKPGSFDATLQAIPLLKKHGIKVVIMSTVSSTNANEIEEIMDAMVIAGADLYAFGRYCPNGPEMDAMIPPEDYRNYMNRWADKMEAWEKEGVSTRFARKDHLWTLHDYENGRFQIPADANSELIYGGCSCGNSHLTIIPSGDVLACRRVADSKVGNALTDSLSEIWLNEMEAYREFDRFEKCSKCELKAWCRGCPGVAKGHSGSFYAADPQCWKVVNETETETETVSPAASVS